MLHISIYTQQQPSGEATNLEMLPVANTCTPLAHHLSQCTASELLWIMDTHETHTRPAVGWALSRRTASRLLGPIDT